MLSFFELIKIFYPSKSSEEQQKLALLLENESIEYYPDTWKEVKREEITLQDVQLNLLRTLYQLQYGYYTGITLEIMTSFEDWTENTLNFNTPFPEINVFYEWVYAFIGFQNFSSLPVVKQIYLLGSRSFFYAVNFNIPVYEKVQELFASTCDVVFLKDTSLLFAGAVRSNKTPMTHFEPKTLDQWILKYENFVPKRVESKVDEFINTIDFTVLNEQEKLRLTKILDIFDAVNTDRIWKEIKVRFCAHGKSERHDEVDMYSRYLELLSEKNDIELWLQDFKNISSWIKAGPQDYWKSMMKVLQKKIDLKNEVEVEALSQFLSYLEGQKLVPEGILSFNETNDQFDWNEELIK